MIGIGSKLRDRDHSVRFVTGPASIDCLRESDFFRCPRGASDGGSFEVRSWLDPLRISMQVKHVEYALERYSCSVLVTSSLAFGPLIARGLTPNADRRRRVCCLPLADKGNARPGALVGQ